MAAIEATAVWIDVSAVEFQAQHVPAQRPGELDHPTIITRRSAAHMPLSVPIPGAPQPATGR
jgi:hypothetical protein